MSPPRVSVAVSTYQRARLLPRLVASLEAQTLPAEDYEVVIADNGSTDDTRRVLQDLVERSSLTIRVVRIERNRGPAGGRNQAWRAARALIVAFTDDDCIPTPTWLESGLRAMNGERRIVVGRTLPDPQQTHRLGPFSLTVTVEDATYFHTCNVFYRREDLAAVDGFDEGFVTPGGEDTDLGWRVQSLGAMTAFDADALVYHDVGESSFRALLRQTLRWTDIPRVVRRHPAAGRRLLHHRLFWKQTHPRVVAAAAGISTALVGVFFSPVWLIALTLTLPWIRFRVRHAPMAPGPRRRWLLLPAAFLIDLLEVLVMVRGSMRHRTLVL